MLISFIFKSSTLIDAPFNCCNVLVKSIPVILSDVVLHICISHAEHVLFCFCVFVEKLNVQCECDNTDPNLNRP